MNLIIILCLLIPLATSNPVNEGASTSWAPQPGELRDDERCELDKYAESIVFMALADDVEGGELRDMIDNRYFELEAYVEFVESFYNYAKYGPGCYEQDSSTWRLLPNFQDRLKYMHLKVYARLTEILYSACTQHYHTEFAYVYNKNESSFTTLENIRVNSDKCLCENAKESGSCGFKGQTRHILGTLNVRAGRIRPDKFLYTDRRAKVNQRIRLSQHHIIPLSLIAKFFKVWMNNGIASPGQNVRTNDCVNILNGRLKRSLQKVTVHKIKKLNEAAKGEYQVNYDISDLVEHDFMNEFFQSLLAHSAGGNIFVGPSDRGPLDPSFGLMGDDAMAAFEVDSEPLIGRERWREMFSLYQRLIKFVEEAPRATAFDRMRNGVELFVAMMMTFSRHDLTLFNENQWELRELSPREMSMLSERLRYIYRGKKFWGIKNSFTRPSRSVPQPVDRCYSMDAFSRQRWYDFFLDLMESLLEGYSLNKSPAWACILNRLHYDFRFYISLTPSNEDVCSDPSFEDHLYTVVSRNPSWHKCISFDDSKPEEWCMAWRRIMLNSDVAAGRFRHNDTRPRHFHRDMETMMNWLLVQVIKDDAQASSALGQVSVSKQKNLDKAVCYSYLNGTALECPNHCDRLKNKELEKTTYSIQSDVYNQEWFKDSHGKLNCRCSEVVEIFPHKSPLPFVGESCNTPRCEDLR